METQQTTTYIAASPYATHPASMLELQVLLLAAVTLFVIGFLLAEKNMLQHIFHGTDETISSLFGPRTRDAL